MKQTIEIEVPDGKKAVWKDNKVVFEDIEQKLPKTWEEFCNNNKIESNECFIGDDSTICYWFGTKYRQPIYKNIMPSKDAAQAHLALMQLHQLRDCYRQGWIPDWNNDLENKYCIVYANNMLRVCVYGTTQRFLSFQSYEIATEFLNNFRDLIKLAGDLI